ncbi:MAG: type II toxin-antitoxin system VapC family toxin [Campylobacterales bacterium]|nr:type II toxin-antitoxin system VapC family toxin [Campylobacterales bacterium]
MNRVFLDTNIVADLLDSSRNNHQKALELIEKLIYQDTTICISEDMITTLYYISKDKEATLDFIENVVLEDWEVLSFGEKVMKEAVALSKKKNEDLEDLLQCLCGKENGCSVIYTNDKKFVDCGIEIVSLEL